MLAVDTSAWHRIEHPRVAQRWDEMLDHDAVGLCDQVRLEILYSARSANDYDELADQLAGLHRIPTSDGAFSRALEVQRALARTGGMHHRSVKIADLLIAASAEASGAVVWHYDADFDRIASVTGQPTRWIARRGTI